MQNRHNNSRQHSPNQLQSFIDSKENKAKSEKNIDKLSLEMKFGPKISMGISPKNNDVIKKNEMEIKIKNKNSNFNSNSNSNSNSNREIIDDKSYSKSLKIEKFPVGKKMSEIYNEEALDHIPLVEPIQNLNRNAEKYLEILRNKDESKKNKTSKINLSKKIIKYKNKCKELELLLQMKNKEVKMLENEIELHVHKISIIESNSKDEIKKFHEIPFNIYKIKFEELNSELILINEIINKGKKMLNDSLEKIEFKNQDSIKKEISKILSFFNYYDFKNQLCEKVVLNPHSPNNDKNNNNKKINKGDLLLNNQDSSNISESKEFKIEQKNCEYNHLISNGSPLGKWLQLFKLLNQSPKFFLFK